MNRIKVAIAGALLALASSHAVAMEARVFFLKSCPVNKQAKHIEELGPLGVALLSKLAGALTGAAIDSLAGALSEEKQVTVTATERMPGWYRKVEQSNTVVITPALVCVVAVVSDGFAERNELPDTAESLKLYEEAAKAIDRASQGAKELEQLKGAAEVLASHGVVGPPAFYLEATFVRNTPGTVFALQPAFVYYPRFLGERVWLGPDTRDLLVQIEFSEPGSSSPFAETKLQFTGLRPGALNSSRISGIRLPWSKPPAVDGTKADGLLVPFNIKLLFTESAKPGRLGKLVGEVVKDQKASLVSAVETETKLAISQVDRQAARNTATEAANSALTAYLTAYDANEAAVKALTAAKAGTDQAAIVRATNAAALTALRLKNAEALARSAFDAADTPFASIPSSAP